MLLLATRQHLAHQVTERAVCRALLHVDSDALATTAMSTQSALCDTLKST
jgi:hypothetical protein